MAQAATERRCATSPRRTSPGTVGRRWPTATEMPDRVDGAALFADISGFTPLTEALANELGPQRGAEELTANLGRVFHAVIAELDRHGGDVIYFSGDAITCWLDGDDGARATAAALAMQDAMARVGDDHDPRRHLGHARAQGRGRGRSGATVRGRRPGHPAHRRARRRASSTTWPSRAPRRQGRGRPRRLGPRGAGRPGRHRRGAPRCRGPRAGRSASSSG